MGGWGGGDGGGGLGVKGRGGEVGVGERIPLGSRVFEMVWCW